MLARRLRTPLGEIDVALLDEGVLVVCEVKTARRAGRFRPGDRLNAAGVARRARAAGWLARAAGCTAWRVDLVEVVVPAARGVLRSDPARVTWVRGIAGPAPPGPDRRTKHSFTARLRR